MRGLVGTHPHERDLDLERRVGEHAQKLQLRVLLDRHQVQDADLERTDVLVDRALLVLHEQVFFFQFLPHREIILDLYRQLGHLL